MYILLLDALAIIVLLAASVTDIKENRIPNKLMFPAMIAACIMTSVFFRNTPIETVHRILGVFVLFISGAFLRYIIGLGDIKAIMLIVLCSGLTRTLYAFLFALILLSVYAVVTEKDHGRTHMRNIFMLFHGLTPQIEAGKKYPLAPFLLIGYIVSLAMTLKGIIP